MRDNHTKLLTSVGLAQARPKKLCLEILKVCEALFDTVTITQEQATMVELKTRGSENARYGMSRELVTLQFQIYEKCFIWIILSHLCHC